MSKGWEHLDEMPADRQIVPTAGNVAREITLYRNGETGEVKISVRLDATHKTRPMAITEIAAETLERLALRCLHHHETLTRQDDTE